MHINYINSTAANIQFTVGYMERAQKQGMMKDTERKQMVASNQLKWCWEKQKETLGFNCNRTKEKKSQGH